MRGKRGGGRGRGRPRGPRPPSARDLAHTPAITTFYGSEQQPIAPIFQQHTGGGAAHVGNEEQEDVPAKQVFSFKIEVNSFKIEVNPYYCCKS